MPNHEGSMSHVTENENRKINRINNMQWPMAISNTGLWHERDAARNSEVLHLFGKTCYELHKRDSV